MNDKTCSKFSIIIPVYDRKEFVRKAVNSCLSQEYNNESVEIIVVKNFLDAGLEKWLKQYSVLYINSDKVSLVDKIIEGVNVASGDIICLLEDDDEFVVDKLKVLDKYYKKYSDIECLHNNFKYLEENGYKIDKFYLKHMTKLDQAMLLDNTRKKLSLISNRDVYHNLSCWSFRKEHAIQLLNDLSGLTYDIDFLIYIENIERSGKMVILPDKITIYRRHESTTRVSLNDDKIISLFQSSIFSLQTVEHKIVNRKLRNFLKSNICVEQFKINIIEKKFPKIKDIKNILGIIVSPPYIYQELYPFLFLYFILGIFRQFRKEIYINYAYILT